MREAAPATLPPSESKSTVTRDEWQQLTMRNLTFGFFDDSGLPRASRILMFYSFETEERLARSGILHFHLDERRFVGPRHDSRAHRRRPGVPDLRAVAWASAGV